MSSMVCTLLSCARRMPSRMTSSETSTEPDSTIMMASRLLATTMFSSAALLFWKLGLMR